MHTAQIAIIGGGLSGLYAAFLLEQQGMRDYVLLEARDGIGGRIASAAPLEHSGRFDLGPSWFWPGLQPQLDTLVRELGLARFEQFETGDMMVERTPNEPAVRMRGYANVPVSMRLAGGTAALTDALHCRLDTTRLFTGQAIHQLHCAGSHMELESTGSTGSIARWRVRHVLLAIPPRLADSSIAFTPPLPAALARQWRATATWMAPHAKYVAVYDAPFWREQGLSGEARSMAGPLGEIHDASVPGGGAALFGFFSMPATVRQRIPDGDLKRLCRAQLARLFGARAAAPAAELVKDWALERYTATAADVQPSTHHGTAPAGTADTGPWHGRLTGIASEWSPQFPGYLAGAIEAASLGIQTLKDFT
jgi:monoamine oxidase